MDTMATECQQLINEEVTEYYAESKSTLEGKRLQEAELIINLSSKSRARTFPSCREVPKPVTIQSESTAGVHMILPSSSSTEKEIVQDLKENVEVLKQEQEGEVLTIERKSSHVCVVCKKSFKSFMALLRHRVKHNKDKEKFSCDICGKQFTEPADLDQHKFKHVEIRLYRCGICNDTFDALENFKFHLRIHDNEGPYVCNICSQVFNKKVLYISHHYQHESVGAPPRNICKICNKVFPELHKYKRHMMYHNQEKFHKCTMCDKTFVERSKLTRHMLIHTHKREFFCPICGQSFTLKYNMKVHLDNIHKGCRNHLCPICQRTFTQKVVLQRHMKIHLPS